MILLLIKAISIINLLQRIFLGELTHPLIKAISSSASSRRSRIAPHRGNLVQRLFKATSYSASSRRSHPPPLHGNLHSRGDPAFLSDGLPQCFFIDELIHRLLKAIASSASSIRADRAPLRDE